MANSASRFALRNIYPWVICVTGLINLVVFNGLTTTALSVFDEELIKTFSMSRTEIRTKEAVTNLVAAVFILVSGFFIDRFRVKRVMLFGATVLTLAFVLYSRISNIFELYFVHFLLGIALITAGAIPTIILVSTWFRSKRGLALGITLMGTSMGGFIFPSLLTHYIEVHGWRETFLVLALLPAAMFLILSLLVKSSPEQLNLQPYGADEVSSPNATPVLSTGMSYRAAIKTTTFWLICVCGFLTFLSIVGVVSNLFLHLRGLGFNPSEASMMLSLYFLVALTGKFLVSTLTDYLNVHRVFSACLLSMTIGVFGFTFFDTQHIYLSIVLTGLSWGGIYTLYNVMIVRSFGLKAAGKINGTINFWESMGSFLGPIFTGLLFDAYQNNEISYWVIGGLMVLATLTSLLFSTYVKSPTLAH